MPDLWNFPYFELEFNKQGNIVDPQEVQQALKGIVQAGTTDLLVMSHGWNNDMDEARRLYRVFFERVRNVLDTHTMPGLRGRTFAILGVLWPSKKFGEAELTAGGAASAGSSVESVRLMEQLDELHGVFDAPDADAKLTRAKQLVAQLDDKRSARKEFTELLRTLLSQSPEQEGEVPQQFFTLPGDVIMERLSTPQPLAVPTGRTGSGGAAAVGSGGAASGSAAGLGNLFGGVRAGARNLLNFLTYYQMKERAGIVGKQGLYQVLRKLQQQQSTIKLHLIGHSFGGRLVTAATHGPEGQPSLTVSSLTLLQAAFSHYGFALDYDGSNDGLFRTVVVEHKVKGPILISHTPNDRAVGLAYPIASRITGQIASGLGDPNDPFGGIGRNGAQKTPEAINGAFQLVGGTYTWEAGKVYNLNADTVITSHSDIAKNEVAYALLSAVATV